VLLETRLVNDIRSLGRIASRTCWGRRPQASTGSGSIMDHPVQRTIFRPYGLKGMDMKTAHSAINGFQEVLERQEADLVRVLRKRDNIAIEKSADQMDEIQLCNGTRSGDSKRGSRVRPAARRAKPHCAGFTTASLERAWSAISAISPKAPRGRAMGSALCIQCQEAADRDRQEGIGICQRRLLLNAA
jgi:hypothetical protein